MFGIILLPSEVILSKEKLLRYVRGQQCQLSGAFCPRPRNIILIGQAYFSVCLDTKAPFIVSTSKHVSAKVLGTPFVVDVGNTTEQVEISVITGLIQIDEDKKRLDVSRPREQLRCSCANRTFSRKKYLSEDIAQWQNNGVIFLNKVSLRRWQSC